MTNITLPQSLRILIYLENMYDSKKEQEPLPSLSQTQKRKSSLRSLQEIQQRRSIANVSQQSRQQIEQQLQQKQMQNQNLLNMTLEFDRMRGKTHMEGIMPFFQPGETQSEKDLEDEQLQIQTTGPKHRKKRSPSSDQIRIKSQPLTPRRIMAQQNLFDPLTAGQAQLRQSLKIQSLAPLDATTIPAGMQTQRNGGSNQQIGPLFANQGSKNSLQVSGGRRSKLRSSSGLRNSASGNIKPRQPWGKMASQFKFEGAKGKEVSNFLQQVIQEPLELEIEIPTDFSYTNPLDTFLEAIYKLIFEKVLDFNEEIQSKVHLAAQIRQESCFDILSYFCQLQTRSKLLIDAVGFFNVNLKQITSLETQKEKSEEEIKQLISEKEALFLTKYDLERKLAEMSTVLKLAQKNEKDAVNQVQSLKERLNAKTAECDSLAFRIQTKEEQILNQVVEAAQQQQQSSVVAKDSPQPEERQATLESIGEAARTINKRSISSSNRSLEPTDQVRQLEAANKKLETELILMKDALQKLQDVQFKDNVDHFVRIQELFNKVQIENKELHAKNKLLQSKQQTQTTLESYLKQQVTSVSLEKEEIIVKLKSEIVLLKSQIETNELNFTQRVKEECANFESSFTASFKIQEKKFHDEKDQLVREIADLRSEKDRLYKEHKQLASEFDTYRAEISLKDQDKQKNINDLQLMLKKASQANESQVSKLQKRIEEFSNDKVVLTKQNSINELRLRLIRDTVETLYREKQFIMQTIQRNIEKLERDQEDVKGNMLKENDNDVQQLISVQKAVTNSQSMLDLGLNAIKAVAKSVELLKIDEVRNMTVKDQESLSKDAASRENNQQQEIEKLNLQFQTDDLISESTGRGGILKHVINDNLQNFKVQKIITTQKLQIMKQDEHFMGQCMVEMWSVMAKVIGELISSCGQQVPNELQRVIQSGSRVADPQTEQQIYDTYLAVSRRMLEDQYASLQEDNRKLLQQLESMQKSSREVVLGGAPSARLRNISNNSGSGVSNPATIEQAEDEGRRVGSASIDQEHLKSHRSAIQTPVEVLSARKSVMAQQRLHSAQRRSIMGGGPSSGAPRQTLHSATQSQQHQAADLSSLELEALRVQLDEQKLKHKDLSIGLAQRIVLLEEQLEEQKLRHEQELCDQVQIQKDEIARTKEGAKQRELQLVRSMNEYKDKFEKTEKKLCELKEGIESYEHEIEKNQTNQNDFAAMIGKKDQEIANYKENVEAYIDLKVSQRNKFSLTFKNVQENMCMITDDMLKYYLNKCVKIDKDKFRILNREEIQIIVEEDTVSIVKVLIEIVDDQANIDKYLKQLKTQVRDGTSLLFDLQPLFLSLNLGQCGLQLSEMRSHQLKEFHLLKRRGANIREQDYVMSVLRHSKDPLSFKVIASSSETGEEFILDLSSRDLIELTEGRTYLLEASEPSELVDWVIENLQICYSSRKPYKVLQCEHKVQFSDQFVKDNKPFVPVTFDDMYSQNALNKDLPDTQAFRSTKFRNNQITQRVESQKDVINSHYQKIIRNDFECQTDIESLLSNSSIPNTRLPQTMFREDRFLKTFEDHKRFSFGRSLEFKIQIEENQKQSCCIVTFEEILSKQRCQIFLIDSQQDLLRNHYIIHTECMKFIDTEGNSHMIIFTFEKFQDDSGFLIKLHDMKAPASVEFFIARKSNGMYSIVNKDSGIDKLLYNQQEHQELRNLLFDLTYTLTVPSKEILMTNLEQMKQLQMKDQIFNNQQIEETTPSDMFQLPELKRISQAKELPKKEVILQPTTTRIQLDQFSQPSSVLLSKHDRGDLLYRNIYTIRCDFDARQDLRESQSLISFYEKRSDEGYPVISVEVFLHTEAQKMSIASQVSPQDLFGFDPADACYHVKAERLDQMMEQLIVQQRGGQYHLKVDNDIVPMGEIKEKRKKEEERRQEEMKQEMHRQQTKIISIPGSSMLHADLGRSGSANNLNHQEIVERKQREIEANPQLYLAQSRSYHVQAYAQINEQVVDYHAYFINKQLQKKDSDQFGIPTTNGSSPAKKKLQQSQLTKKAPIERQVSLVSHTNLEDLVDFDWIYLEIIDKDNISHKHLLSVKLLIHILTSNPLESANNQQLLQSKDEQLKEKIVDLLKSRTKLDEDTGAIKIECYQPSHEYAIQVISNEIGGSFMRRDDQAKQIELEKSLIEKRLLINQEVELSEYTYDLKLYQIFNKPVQSSQMKVFSYCFEIFCLNEPDLVYKYNYALHEQSSFVHSPIHLGFDVVNLVENSLNRVRDHEDPVRKQEFSALKNKYIDNTFYLVVQDQIFPHQITFCLYEPSSRLHWSYAFNPQQSDDSDYLDTLSRVMHPGQGRWNIELGQLSILDQGTAERFIALVMNEVLSGQSSLAEPTREDRWNDIGDIETIRYDMVRGELIEEEIAVNISKIGMDCLNIEIYNPKYTQDMLSAQKVSRPRQSSAKQQQNKPSQTLTPQAPEVPAPSPHMVKFLLNASTSNKYVCKLLRLKDQEVNRLLVLTCDLFTQGQIAIRIVELRSSTVILDEMQPALTGLKPRILYQYVFKEKNITSTTKVNIERRHLSESIAQVSSLPQSAIDRAGQLYDIIIGKKPPKKTVESMFIQESVSLTQKRLISSASLQMGDKGDRQPLILHRKTFYDEQNDKLIIVSVSIDNIIDRGSKKVGSAAQMCRLEADTFRLNIAEPETGASVDIDTKISYCFPEVQAPSNINLKNLNHLKKMARVLVEERAIIKRASQPDDIDNAIPQYSVEINLNQMSPLDVNESSAASQDNQKKQQVINEEEYKQQEENYDHELIQKVPVQQKTLQPPSASQVPHMKKSSSFRQTAAENMGQSIIEEESQEEQEEDSPDIRGVDYSQEEESEQIDEDEAESDENNIRYDQMVLNQAAGKQRNK